MSATFVQGCLRATARQSPHLRSESLRLGQPSSLAASSSSLHLHRAFASSRTITTLSRHVTRTRPSDIARAFSTTLPNAKLPTIDDAYKKTSVQELSSLKGKVAVVTGGGRGIGLALARGIVENGGDVAILDALKEPHPDFHEMQKEFPESKIQFYQ